MYLAPYILQWWQEYYFRLEQGSWSQLMDGIKKTVCSCKRLETWTEDLKYTHGKLRTEIKRAKYSKSS